MALSPIPNQNSTLFALKGTSNDTKPTPTFHGHAPSKKQNTLYFHPTYRFKYRLDHVDP